MTSNEITNSADVIDSRDVIERIAYLADEDYLRDAEEDRELANLRALADECENDVADWPYGETLIRESYFTAYAQELADDIGLINADAKWPLNHIDWEAAAEELKGDYSEYTFDGVTYYAR